MEPIGAPGLEEVGGARGRIAGSAVRTPLVRLDEYPGIYLKLECLQPIGSFKIRGAANAIALADPAELVDGVYTASAGNMAQGVALAARTRGLSCRVVVPDTAPQAKLEAIRRLGATSVPLPWDEWWGTIRAHGHPDESGFFIHPVADRAVIAGNGTIGLEILEDLPDVDVIVAPYGGGGLSTGIAAAVRARLDADRADTGPDADRAGAGPEGKRDEAAQRDGAPRYPRVYASEVETAAPLAESLEAGEPLAVERRTTFVDGIGGGSVLEEMWTLASTLLDGSLVVTIEEICDAIRMLATRARVIGEGAAGSAVAAALELRRREDPEAEQRIVAVVSGGNIDTHVLRAILSGENPDA